MGSTSLGPTRIVRRINARTKVWAAGVCASPLAAMLADAIGVKLDRWAVGCRSCPSAHCPATRRCSSSGDMMSLNGLPGVAEVALQSGRHAAAVIMRRLHDDAEAKPFRYRDLGTLASISKLPPSPSVGPVRVSGFAGWLLWLWFTWRS